MRVRVLLLVLAAVVVQSGAESVQACGDKFLLASRGAKFRQAYAAIYPASVIVFARPERSSAKAMRDPRFLADLKQAGHRVSLIDDERALSRALQADRIDVLLTDAADADQVATRANAAPTKPRILPVMFKPTKEAAKAVEARYETCLKSDDRPGRYLATIDEMMKARKKKAA